MLRLATRPSPLARWQAEEVARLLRAAHPDLETELVPVHTAGDRDKQRSFSELGGTGVFVKEVQAAVLDGRADVAVHSAKDLPSTEPDGLTLAAFPPRADPRDCLVGTPVAGLPDGATVATGSVRRRAQLAWQRPDLHFVDLRGNIATRLERVPPGGAVVMAQAALDRLGLAHRAAETLDPAVMLPQVGQGAMAVECRTGDTATVEVLAAINDLATSMCVRAERAFLGRLGSGCSLPVAAHAILFGTDAHLLEITGLIAAPDGSALLRLSRGGPADAAVSLGAGLATGMLASKEGQALWAATAPEPDAATAPAATAPAATGPAGIRPAAGEVQRGTP